MYREMSRVRDWNTPNKLIYLWTLQNFRLFIRDYNDNDQRDTASGTVDRDDVKYTKDPIKSQNISESV